MIVRNIHCNEVTSIRRLARTFAEPVSTVGRWLPLGNSIGISNLIRLT